MNAGPSAIPSLDNTPPQHDPQQQHLIEQQQQQQRQQQQQPQQQANSSTPLIATGDWTKDLVHLAKTAELKYVPINNHLSLQCMILHAD